MLQDQIQDLATNLKGNLNRWEVGVQVFEAKILKGTIKDRAIVQKMRNKIQLEDMETRLGMASKIAEAIFKLDGGIIKPSREIFGQKIVDSLNATYGDLFENNFGVGYGLGASKINRYALEKVEEATKLMENLAKCDFERCVPHLEPLGDRPLGEVILGEDWGAVSDCRNVQKSIDPTDLDSLEYGLKYGVNFNWKLSWSQEGLHPRSEELPFDPKDIDLSIAIKHER